MSGKSVLIVDDEESIRTLMRFNLISQGYAVETASSGEEGLAKYNQYNPDLVITDIMMEGITGLDVLKRVKSLNPDAMVIVVTGYGSLDSAVEALRQGAYDYLRKPYNREEFSLKVKKCLQKQSVERQVRTLTQSLLELNERLRDEIAQKAKSEEKLKQLTFELERSNQSLMEFSMVASHDLQEPLRKVSMFTGRIREEYEQSLDARANGYFEIVENSVRRMGAFIHDLLELAKVKTEKKPFELVNLNDIVDGVLSDLEVRLQESGGRVFMESLPALDADPLQMRQLFQNLIGNALKFRRPETPCEIRITSSRNAGDIWEIRVTDNGIGLDNENWDKIFQPFERLHGRSSYEGTGLGLAICDKIVSRHGGKIRAEGVRGEGSTFIITLPEKQPGDKEGT